MKKNLLPFKILISSIILTTIYLSFGFYLNHHLWQTNYVLTTFKELGQDNLRIIQISDVHLGTTFHCDGFTKIIKKISQIDSDLIVITGDLVDDDTIFKDLSQSLQALKLLKPKYGIYFVFGNHDEGYFNYRDFKTQELIEELQKNNVHVLQDDMIDINEYITIIGRNDKRYKSRKSIESLTKNIDQNKYIIDLNHQPNDYPNEQNKVDLVLSGHTHGGQLFPLGYLGVLIGANDAFYGLHHLGKTNFIISSGLSDWKTNFKTGTVSEYVIIDIKKTNH